MCTIDGNKCQECVTKLENELSYWKEVSRGLINVYVVPKGYDVVASAPFWMLDAMGKLKEEK